MSQEEFLLVFHGVIFGMAVVDLVSHTRDIFTKSYWEYIVWAIALFDIGALNWYSTYNKIEVITEGYGWYVLFMLPAILYYVVVRIFTPEEGVGYKEYFLSNIKPFIGMLFIYAVVVLLTDYLLGASTAYFAERFVMVILLIPAYFINRVWVRMLPLIYRFTMVMLWISGVLG